LGGRGRVVEYLRHGEGHDGVAGSGGDDDLFVKRIENDSNVGRLPNIPEGTGSGCGWKLNRQDTPWNETVVLAPSPEDISHKVTVTLL
jgi:hypothetical protein